MNVHDVIRRPLVTEKSSIGRDEHNLATFAVLAQVPHQDPCHIQLAKPTTISEEA